jgi:nitrite reductase/ring-hydroxylating ferredoxin subunit
MSEFEFVARVEDVPEDDLLGVETVRGERICLVNCGGAILAVADNCTHQEFPMSSGVVLDGCVIECAWHGARFDCRTGSVLKGPAEEPIATYEVKVVEGEIFVGGRKLAG